MEEPKKDISAFTSGEWKGAQWQKKAAVHYKAYDRMLQKSGKNKILKQLPRLHEEAFSVIDCLNCAACCKNYSPRFKTPDIKRISRHLKMKESVFIDVYLRLDEEGDYVVKQTPCPFLGSDNRCSIYAVRPSDCERFPYTDEDVLINRARITLKNSTFCPAVFFVLEKLLETSQK
ncbi:YkgJ family cysteine cluster protein [Agriterribacter sp.]|uniref:YkgJ family cysteine cluster protein n=1 Tax=Agriterribacter sp. TaxID=2821509 RepID=UPI002BB82F7B|nr:YkgJ family cysteine cluster protein [Agriterribacter sp.]HRP55394.1 YkgJ family cysteine cluster protein [Agriterribacter sp.]